jgi:hypothetical protein
VLSGVRLIPAFTFAQNFRLALEEVRMVIDTSICNLCSQLRHESQLMYELSHCPLQDNTRSCCLYPAHPSNWTSILDSIQYECQCVRLLLATHFPLLRSRYSVWLFHRYIHDEASRCDSEYTDDDTTFSWCGTFSWFTFRTSAKFRLCAQIIARLIETVVLASRIQFFDGQFAAGMWKARNLKNKIL